MVHAKVQNFMTAPLTLVLGGAASGKSAYAEQTIRAYARPKVYIATAQAFDDEMKDKIRRHREDRGDGWMTIEAPITLAEACLGVPPDHTILIDCLTLWLTNLMLAEADIDSAQTRLFDALDMRKGPVVLVSNEVGQGIVPEHALSRRFREAQGRLNILAAARSDRVVQVVAGLPNILKGDRE